MNLKRYYKNRLYYNLLVYNLLYKYLLKIRSQKATKRRKQRQNNTWFGMIGCRCTWTPDDIIDIDNIDDLEDRFLRVVYDITEEVAFNLGKSLNDKNITA